MARHAASHAPVRGMPGIQYQWLADYGNAEITANFPLPTCVVTRYIGYRDSTLDKMRSLTAGELVAHQELRQTDMAKAPECFAETVKEVPLQLGHSQEELARELSVSFSTINRWGKKQDASLQTGVKAIRSFL